MPEEDIDAKNYQNLMPKHFDNESFETKIIEQNDSIKLGEKEFYDTDFVQLEDHFLLGYIIENRYILYDLENKTKKIKKLKDCTLKINEEVMLFFNLRFSLMMLKKIYIESNFLNYIQKM